MEFRKSKKSDIKEIINIIEEAQNYFRENNIDQWQDGYPNEESIINDIENGESYVLLKDNKVIATAYLSFSGEMDYNIIYDGKWISNEDYAVVHRVAVSRDIKGNGVAAELFKHIEKICLANNINYIRIDTHRHNKSMQKFLSKNKFEHCGVIYLKDKSERIAFEKILRQKTI